MSSEVLNIALFTVICAALATALMLVPGIAVAWLLARRSFPGKAVVETFVSLPLVVPPVARMSFSACCDSWAVSLVARTPSAPLVLLRSVESPQIRYPAGC